MTSHEQPSFFIWSSVASSSVVHLVHLACPFLGFNGAWCTLEWAPVSWWVGTFAGASLLEQMSNALGSIGKWKCSEIDGGWAPTSCSINRSWASHPCEKPSFAGPGEIKTWQPPPYHPTEIAPSSLTMETEIPAQLQERTNNLLQELRSELGKDAANQFVSIRSAVYCGLWINKSTPGSSEVSLTKRSEPMRKAELA
jgi:hypothetical protein